MEKLRIRSAQYSLGGGTPAFFALAAAAVDAAELELELPVTAALDLSAAVDMCNLLVVEPDVKVRLLGAIARDPPTHAAAVGNCRRKRVAVVTETAIMRRKFRDLDIIVFIQSSDFLRLKCR
jgi:hypothetical protein